MASPQSINFLIVLAQTNDRIKKLSRPKKQIFQIPWLPRSVFAGINPSAAARRMAMGTNTRNHNQARRPEGDERRRQRRCVKDVSMHCARLHGAADHLITVRNFSSRGVYFESERAIQSGALVVLRTIDAGDYLALGPNAALSPFAIGPDDPEVCTGYRSHTLVTVQRCVKLNGHEGVPRYGVGAAIQILTD
jgi:hypothetical protein